MSPEQQRLWALYAVERLCLLQIAERTQQSFSRVRRILATCPGFSDLAASRRHEALRLNTERTSKAIDIQAALVLLQSGQGTREVAAAFKVSRRTLHKRMSPNAVYRELMQQAGSRVRQGKMRAKTVRKGSEST